MENKPPRARRREWGGGRKKMNVVANGKSERGGGVGHNSPAAEETEINQLTQYKTWF